MQPTILFEDANLVVLDKPAGLLCQGDKTGENNLVEWLRHYFGRHYVGLVHRLDRNTSGVMVVAKRTKAARRLTDALVSRELTRTYLAWIEGSLKEASGRWHHWLLKSERENHVHIVSKKERGAKEAILDYRTVKSTQWKKRDWTLMEIELETGRSHQIRAQAACEGHPLLGDKKYGGYVDFPRVALHSYQIKFPHPISKETLEFDVPLPKELCI